MKWKETALLIISNDEALFETLGGKLGTWGARAYHLDSGSSTPCLKKPIDIILVDIRREHEESLLQLKAAQKRTPFAETILININGNINASMAGMRAGASDELTVPFDTEILRKKINAACGRSRKRQAKQSLFSFFEKTMSAATFAQAGEFTTALNFFENNEGRPAPPSGQTENPEARDQQTSQDEKEGK